MPAKMNAIKIVLVSFFIVCTWLFYPRAFAASGSADLLKIKRESELKGYAFFANRDEIVSNAKKEGKLHAALALEGSLKVTAEAFKRSFPFIDLQIQNLRVIEDSQKALLQVKAGAAKDWDIVKTTPAFYSEWLPHIWKVDLLRMAEHGVLDMSPKMIDPKNRNVIALGSRLAVVAYNKNLVSPGRVPKSWEDMLRPEFKGRKFGSDIHPSEIAGLVPAWGLEKTLDYARRIAAQEPIWTRGSSRSITAVTTGEIPILLFGASYSIARRAQQKDPLGIIQFTLLEPVPVRYTLEQGILSTSRNPHAALLWLEFMAGLEAQKLIDEHEPLVASLYTKGSSAEQALRGKKLSIVSWENNEELEQWIARLTGAYGFPKTESK